MTSSDTSTADMQRDDAFAAALVELFKQHPLHESMHEVHHAVRGSAIRKARNGGYRGVAVANLHSPWLTHEYWRKELRKELAPDWRIPPDEVVAIHLLIYG